MTAASAAMGRAVTSLDALNTSAAMPPEMQALNALLKAQADVKRREISREQAGSGRGDNNRNYDMSALFDKELQRQQQTNYETKSSSETRKDENTSALDAIKDLARRQDELLKHQLELAKQRAQMSEEAVKRQLEQLTREQSELRQQAEELAARMAGQPQQAAKSDEAAKSGRAGASGQAGEAGKAGEAGESGRAGGTEKAGAGNSDGGERGRQLREASEAMRSAASDLRRENPAQASESGSRALDKLRDLERQMQSAGPDERRRALGELQLEAQQLAASQRDLASESAKAPPGTAGADEARRLAGEEERLADRTRKLGSRLEQEASSAAGAAGKEARSVAAGDATERGARDARRAAGDAARDLQSQHLAERMQKIADDMRAAAGKASATGQDARAQAAAQEQLAGALHRMADKIGAATGSRDDASAKLSEQLARAQELRDRMAQTGQEIERLGKQKANGSQPSAQKAPGGTGKTGEGTQGGNGGSGSDLARLQQEYQRQLEQTRDLVNQLKRDDPAFAKSGTGFTFEGQGMVLSAPGTEAFKQDFAAWEVLRQQATQALDKAESAISQKLQSKEAKDRLAAGVEDRAPSEYQQQVDSYFKALAARKK